MVRGARIVVCLLSLCLRAGGELSFLAVGDWGGEDDAQPATRSQELTAAGLKAQAAAMGNVDLVLMLGDNVYHHGVNTSAENTSRFRDTFEDVYTKLIPDLPFYAMAGNHDYGQGKQANVSAQLAYTQLSRQWRFPSLWYKIQRNFSEGGQTRFVEVLVIDTVVLCGNGPENEKFIENQLRACPQGSTSEESPGSVRRAMAEEQWAWLEGELSASRADYLWVAGHYPIWSGGEDGSEQCLTDRLRPMLIRHGAQYICGHDHMLEHFSHEGLETFVVGVGKECCYAPVTMHRTPPGALKYMLAGHLGNVSEPAVPFPVYGGFASLRFTAEFAQVTFHADSGRQLYTSPPIARRGGVGPALRHARGATATWSWVCWFWFAWFWAALYLVVAGPHLLRACKGRSVPEEPNPLLLGSTREEQRCPLLA